MTSAGGRSAATDYFGARRKARRLKRRKSPKRVAAGRKAARTRARKKAITRSRRRYPAVRMAARRWRRLRGRRHRLVVRRIKRGLMRSPYSRLGYRRGRRVRINPRFSLQRILGQWQLKRAVPILGGFIGAITLKPIVKNYLMNMIPVTMQPTVEKFFGVATIAAGAFLSARSRRSTMKDVGLGLIVGGVYDLIASNFANLPFIPQVTPGFMPGAAANVPVTGMGASIGRGAGYSIVGASNLSMDMEPDVIGSEDLDDLI